MLIREKKNLIYLVIPQSNERFVVPAPQNCNAAFPLLFTQTHLHVVYPLWEKADESFRSPNKDLKVLLFFKSSVLNTRATVTTCANELHSCHTVLPEYCDKALKLDGTASSVSQLQRYLS